MEREEKIDYVVSEAEQAFWKVVAENYPEIVSGDFSPSATVRLQLEMKIAIKVWLIENQ